MLRINRVNIELTNWLGSCRTTKWTETFSWKLIFNEREEFLLQPSVSSLMRKIRKSFESIFVRSLISNLIWGWVDANWLRIQMPNRRGENYISRKSSTRLLRDVGSERKWFSVKVVRIGSRWRFLRNTTFIVKLSHLPFFLFFFDNWKMLKGLFINYVKAGVVEKGRHAINPKPTFTCLPKSFKEAKLFDHNYSAPEPLVPIYRRRRSWFCNSGDWLFPPFKCGWWKTIFFLLVHRKSQKAAAAWKCLQSGFRLLSQNRIFFSSPTLRLWSHRIAQGKQIVCLIWSWIESHELSIYMLFVFYVVEHFILVVLNPMPSPWWLGAL